MRQRFAGVVLGMVVAFVACKPEFGDRESLLETTRILAVRGEPPEARPGEAVAYSVLVASPSGRVVDPVVAWAYCTLPKLLTENGAVSAACLGAGTPDLAVGPPAITAAVPSDACFAFGPDVSSAELRPRDADVTGGYYQPIRVRVAGAGPPAIGLERIRCNLANAGAENTADFDRRYLANRNPVLLPLEARLGEDAAPLEALPRAARVTFRAKWRGEDAERYVALDLVEQRLTERRESMRVSWFATAGAFANDRTGRAEDDLGAFTDNDWTAPNEARTTHLFVVLRDARGGVAYAAYEVRTR